MRNENTLLVCCAFCVKLVMPSGSTYSVSILAGSAVGFNDGVGPGALFYSPGGIALDSSGSDLYVCDTNNHVIRRIVLSTGTRCITYN